MARGKAGATKARKRKTKRRNRPAKAVRRPRGELALAMFAHEVRTGLTGVLAFGELLAAGDLGPREREWATAVRSSAEQLTALTTLMIDAAKARSTRLPLRTDVFRPRQLAEAVAANLAARAAARGLTATVAVNDDLPEIVRGDAVRLRAALENLIDNAVKFTKRGTVGLTVTAAPAQRGRVCLGFVIFDTGIGLDPASIRRVFRPFAQANADISHRYGGAGLGLAAVQRIAEAMGGSLTVASAPGRGSRFRLDVVMQLAGADNAAAPQRSR